VCGARFGSRARRLVPDQGAELLDRRSDPRYRNSDLAKEEGFGDRTAGTVHIRLLDKAREFGLEVSDDGTGLPEGFEMKDSLGLQIVEALAMQDLHGEFELGANRDGVGTRASLRLPKLPAV
jgi:hypothetical protein